MPKINPAINAKGEPNPAANTHKVENKINRIPSKSEIRANIHIGGKAKKTKLTKKEIKICEKIKTTLKSRGLFFAGIDVIDDFLTEINVTSPTCIREINYFNKDNIAAKFWDSFEDKYFS